MNLCQAIVLIVQAVLLDILNLVLVVLRLQAQVLVRLLVLPLALRLQAQVQAPVLVRQVLRLRLQVNHLQAQVRQQVLLRLALHLQVPQFSQVQAVVRVVPLSRISSIPIALTILVARQLILITWIIRYGNRIGIADQTLAVVLAPVVQEIVTQVVLPAQAPINKVRVAVQQVVVAKAVGLQVLCLAGRTQA